ncbi:MAG: Tad domain-containing protein [Candidatus Binatia bacterium]
MSEERSAMPRRGPRRSLLRNDSGQIIIFWLIFAIPMAMLMFSVYNVGQLAAEKQKIQTTADNAAYSAAVWEARYMNLAAYTNRAMVANYDTMAMVLSLWSMLDAWDGFLYLVDFIVEKIPIINALSAITKPLHQIVHQVDKIYGTQVVGGSSQQQRVLYVMEMYNRVLSYAQRALYFLNQAGRKRVIETIGWGMDTKIQYLSWAELLNAISLNSRVKWEGTDKDKGLRLTTERSLNEWSRGESLRDTDNFKWLTPINAILLPIDVVCTFFGGKGVQLAIGARGYNVKAFNQVTGEIPSTCNLDSDEFGCSADIVQDVKLYEHDFAGIILDMCVVSLSVGHHSDDSFNIGENSIGLESGEITVGPPHVFDMPPPEHTQNFNDNGINCTSPGVPGSGNLSGLGAANTSDCDNGLPGKCGFGPVTPAIQQDTANMCEQSLNQDDCDSPTNPDPFNCPPSSGSPSAACSQFLSDDASFDACQADPANCTSGYCASAANRSDPSDRQDILDNAARCENDIYGPGASAGVPLNAGAVGAGGGICETIYNFDTPLKDMEVTTYVPDTDIDASLDGRRLQGPTVFVYFEKKQQFLPMFEGLYFPPRRTIGAYSFAKVYYAQRVGDTGTPDANRQTSNKESVFNPFWTARLERLADFLFH